MVRKKIAILFSLLIALAFMAIPSADAKVLSLDTDKHSFYMVGDALTFSGTTDTPFDIVQVVIYAPPDEEGKKKLVTAQGMIAGSDLKFEDTIEIKSGIFTKHGIYSAIAFLQEGQPVEEGITVLFDFSVDGSPVVPSAYAPPLELKPLNDLTINEMSKLVFTAALVNSYSGNETLTFSLENNPPTGAIVSSSSGAFSWTPTEAQGPGSYTFDIVVKAGLEQDRESLTITVNEVADAPPPPPEPEPNIPDFVEPAKGAQYYLDRYKEPAYKNWFDTNFPDYTIEEAIELAIPDAFSEPEEPKTNVPDFVDPAKGAQYYLDRYKNEVAYKNWFDTNFPDYTIEEAIELAIPGSFLDPEPVKTLAPFVDPKQDPQYYIDRYNSEPSYKVWFDENFPDQTIYDAVGIAEPKTGICGSGTKYINGVCISVSQGGGCLIATAAFGSELSEQVQSLREMRDNTVLGTESGSAFMATFNSVYYTFSPTIADWERESPIFKNAVRVVITPLLTSLSILNTLDIDSEEKMLGYGIGVILLNVGMYFVGPTIAIFTARKYLIK